MPRRQLAMPWLDPQQVPVARAAADQSGHARLHRKGYSVLVDGGVRPAGQQTPAPPHSSQRWQRADSEQAVLINPPAAALADAVGE
eukprot:3400483-Pleurochrysis_carterae.AAC.2